MSKKLEDIKEYLLKNDMDAYIAFSYENSNTLLKEILGKHFLTRKVFAFFNRDKENYLLVNQLDYPFVKDSDFKIFVYKTYQEMLALEKEMIKDYKRVLVDISEDGVIPSISTADYGSVNFIRNQGIEVFSSGDLLTYLNCRIDEKGFLSMQEACRINLHIKDLAFEKIKEDILNRGYSDEYEIQKFIADKYEENDLFFDEPPIVAVNNNASNPHYFPTVNSSRKIYRGDVVLIDMWCKLKNKDSIYSDITWMGEADENVSLNVEKRFNVLKNSIDLALLYLHDNLSKRDVYGYQIDDVVRNYIRDKGYDKYFIHRTGHSIFSDLSPHGKGVNIDDYETRDERRIINDIAFSLEPGIYMDDFGMRSETDVFIHDNVPVIVGGRQEKVIPILK